MNATNEDSEDPLFPVLGRYVTRLLAQIDPLPADPERRAVIEQLAAFIRARQAAGEPARLMFVCTHNSRRSHMGQLWAAAAAAHFGVDHIVSSSGGTQATAMHPNAIAAMRRAGFSIVLADAQDIDDTSDNPRYEVRWGPSSAVIAGFSKTWQHPLDADEGFAAIMTCAEADDACPLVDGAALRVSLPYEDPKLADGTAIEAARYDERAKQIGAEMLQLFGLVARPTG